MDGVENYNGALTEKISSLKIIEFVLKLKDMRTNS